jgi:hypothetical protein
VRHSDGGVGRGGRVTSKDDDVRQRGALGPKMTEEKLQMQGGRRGRTRDAATGGMTTVTKEETMTTHYGLGNKSG